MVRMWSLAICAMLSLSLLAQSMANASVLAPRLVLTREQVRTDSRGLRCVVGRVEMFMPDEPPDAGVFVAVNESPNSTRPGRYRGGLAWTSGGVRLVFGRAISSSEEPYTEIGYFEPLLMDELFRTALAAPFVVERLMENSPEPQLLVGDALDEQGCGVHGEPNELTGAESVEGAFITVAIDVVDAVREQPQSQPAAARAADLRERVVNVRNARGQSIGAGVVLGRTANRFYIMTAKHVVWSPEEEKVPGVTVSFFSTMGESFPAIVLDLSDDQLDLAVLAIPASTPGLPDVGNLVVGKPRELTLGKTVRSIGHPAGALWKMAGSPEKFSRRASSGLEFESLILSEGSSGGGLFNACGGLVGMTRQAGTTSGVATPIDRLLDRLTEWNIEVPITETACGSE